MKQDERNGINGEKQDLSLLVGMSLQLENLSTITEVAGFKLKIQKKKSNSVLFFFLIVIVTN